MTKTSDHPHCVLIDRDGVLVEEGQGYLTRIQDVRLIPGSAAALGRLCAASYHVLVATNQAGVGKRLLTAQTLDLIHQEISLQLADHAAWIDGWYVCPHVAEDSCDCRKPKPGLILRAQQEWGFVPEATWFVGDAERDCQAASAAGCKAALVSTGKRRERFDPMDVPVFDDLAAFVDFLLRE
jgi:D-glycero-D-manno-heptose 1,7-bisphosphate phosphatase